MFFQVEKPVKTKILVPRFAEGANLLAQQIVVMAQLLVLFREQAARLDEREMIAQFHERRAKLYKNHA